MEMDPVASMKELCQDFEITYQDVIEPSSAFIIRTLQWILKFRHEMLCESPVPVLYTQHLDISYSDEIQVLLLQVKNISNMRVTLRDIVKPKHQMKIFIKYLINYAVFLGYQGRRIQSNVDAWKNKAGEIDTLEKQLDELKSQSNECIVAKGQLAPKINALKVKWESLQKEERIEDGKEDFGAEEKEVAELKAEVKMKEEKLEKAKAALILNKNAQEKRLELVELDSVLKDLREKEEGLRDVRRRRSNETHCKSKLLNHLDVYANEIQSMKEKVEQYILNHEKCMLVEESIAKYALENQMQGGTLQKRNAAKTAKMQETTEKLRGVNNKCLEANRELSKYENILDELKIVESNFTKELGDLKNVAHKDYKECKKCEREIAEQDKLFKDTYGHLLNLMKNLYDKNMNTLRMQSDE